VGLDLLRLVLELDPTVAVVEQVELRVTNQEQVERFENLLRGDFRIFQDCFDHDGDGVPEDCTFSDPLSGQFNATHESFLFVDVLSQNIDYPGRSATQVATLKVRIREEPGAPNTELKLANLKQTVNGFETEVISGGRLYPPSAELGFSPVKTFEGGKITVLGFQERRLLPRLPEPGA
jgi:hypothetical protein